MSDPVRVCVVGVGAIGSLYAAHLGRAEEVEVWAYDIVEAHVAAINDGGLRVTGRADFVSPVRATSDAAAIPPCALGIVATKAEHTATAMAAVAHVFTDGAVASVQNGLGNEEVVAEFAPRVIRGSILPAGALAGPGVVRLDSLGPTWLGPFEPQPARAEEIELLARLLTEGGLPAEAMADARGAQWGKVAFNAATSPIAALTGLSIGQLGERPDLRALVEALAAETTRVCEAIGVDPPDPVTTLEREIVNAYAHKPSMLQDVLARRRTEVDVLTGGVASAARDAGVRAPLHEALTALVHGLEASWAATSESGMRH
ncbi:ketopantoate reductase family protein [Nocardioides mangrovicus]|uniref:ketopantoate reductase family protein n=1 Tax=Nocardioides mangrovicus TaxID=2478913 RepID=UPI001313F17A|nr:2-dehydropantoate 2-reductase [Nocardioides mangrovicus]